MAIATQNNILNIQSGSVPVTVHLSQGDVGNTLGFYIYNGSEPVLMDGFQVSVHGIRSDGVGFGPFTVTTRANSNYVTFGIRSVMAAVMGAALAELTITNGSGASVGTANFAMLVEQGTFPDGPVYSTDISVYQQILNYVQTIPASVRSDYISRIATVQNGLDAETAARQSADNTLQSNINAEASTRATTDASLQSQIDQLVAPSGEAPSAAEIENARIGADGVTYPTLGDAIRTNDSDLKSQLMDNVAPRLTWANGEISASSGNISAYATRLVCGSYLDVCDCSVPDTARLRIAVYGDYYAFLGMYAFDSVHGTYGQRASRGDILTAFPGAKYVRFVFIKSPEGAITPADIANYNVVISQPRYIEPIHELYDCVNYLYYGKVAQGGLTSAGLEDGGNALRLRTPYYIPVESGERYEIVVVPAPTVTREINVSVSFYAVADFVTSRTSYTNFETLNNGRVIITIPSDAKYIRALVGYVGNAAINAVDVERVEVRKLVENESGSSNGYVIGSDLLKTNIYAEKIGTITQLQSFCVYEGNFYSTDGSNLTKQDENFNVLNTASVSLGHGNSLQLGSNGKAYSSGWNDNKVYIVDLASMTVDGSITLPTSGYTTAVIDDKKGLAYIFQRGTYPTTEEQYNFIVYDYVNQQTIMTTKTAPFAALQSCDLYNDRIMVVNGGGTSAMPNGYKVYDTSGNVLADYILPTFSTLEPEGVCVDRDTGVLMLSFNTKDLYTVSLS